MFAQINLNYFKPHRNKVVFSIAEICFTGITLKYLIALLMTGMESGEEDPAMATYMIVIDLGVTISGVLGMVMAFFVLYRKIRAVERNLKKKQRTGSTKVGPKISEDEAAHVLLMERQKLHDQIMSSSAKMELKTQGERQLHEHLLELMRIEKDVFNLLDESQKKVTKLETKLHVQAHRALAAGGGKVPTHDVHLLHDEMIALRSAQVSRLNHGAHSIDTLLSKMFHTFDTQSIGRLGPPQLKALFLELMRENATYEDLKAGIDAEHVIAAVDQDKNGAIEEKEFVMWIKRGIAQTEKKRQEWGTQSPVQARLLSFLTAVVVKLQKDFLSSVFLEFDHDKDGQIMKTELVALMLAMKMRGGKSNVNDSTLLHLAADADIVLRALDADKNGSIQLEEFVSWLVSGLGRPREERRAWAAQGQIYARLEDFLMSVEATSKSNGFTTWKWARMFGESGADTLNLGKQKTAGETKKASVAVVTVVPSHQPTRPERKSNELGASTLTHDGEKDVVAEAKKANSAFNTAVPLHQTTRQELGTFNAEAEKLRAVRKAHGARSKEYADALAESGRGSRADAEDEGSKSELRKKNGVKKSNARVNEKVVEVDTVSQERRKVTAESFDIKHYYVDEPPVQKAEITSLFQSYDENGSGQLGCAEVLKMMQKHKRSLGMFVVDESDCKVIMAALDKDDSGEITIEEFADWIFSGLRRSPEERIEWSSQSSATTHLDMFLAAIHKDVLECRKKEVAKTD